jgi:hypothetical protein|tara:strand:+ start:1545 stop:1847 length:303 start_codon:yes stop_codon:yes gene_type:complete
MAHYPVFPRFPFSFNDNITRKMWELNENWANHLRSSLETQDATVIKRKVEVDSNSSIEVQGRIRVGEVTTSVTPVAGDMRYNTSTNKFQGWNGSAWQDFN